MKLWRPALIINPACSADKYKAVLVDTRAALLDVLKSCTVDHRCATAIAEDMQAPHGVVRVRATNGETISIA